MKTIFLPEKEIKERKSIENSKISKIDINNLTDEEQISLINKFYLQNTNIYNDLIGKEINKKLGGYKQQDIEKKIFNKNIFVDLDFIIEQLVISKLKCYYCKNNMKILYTKSRDMTQWSIDRINNKEGHNSNNILISCLACNLQRRCKDKDKFYYTKNLKINKI